MTEEDATHEEQKRTWSPARRAAAENRRRTRSAAGVKDVRGDAELVAEEVIGEAVDNMITLAGFAMPIAPHTAVTIAGVPEPDTRPEEGRWLVKSRAVMAGNVLLEHAKRNPRILQVVARFNLMFKNVELLEVAGAVVAAAAVDAKVVEPDAVVALPGGLEMPILAPVIGDTIAYIAAQQAQASPPAYRVDKRPDRGAAASAEGAEGDEPRDEPTPAQRAEAARTRARILARENALANGQPDPTLRREGQTIVPGGVEDT